MDFSLGKIEMASGVMALAENNKRLHYREGFRTRKYFFGSGLFLKIIKEFLPNSKKNAR